MSPVAEQYADPAQQRSAAVLGMWVFLATEVLFFGPLFLGYLEARLALPAGFAAGSHHTDFALGTANTAILLTSSLTMAMAVEFAKRRQTRLMRLLLFVTIVLGLAFLGIKGTEYRAEIGEGLLPGAHFHPQPPAAHGAELFFWLYFAMTGLHAVHLCIGVGALAWLIRSSRRTQADAIATRAQLAGLYWHFVDCIWVFLYPLLYLLERYR